MCVWHFRKEEELQKREEDLRLKDRELQDSLIGFSKFLQVSKMIRVQSAKSKNSYKDTILSILMILLMHQENNTKRVRAEKKADDEARIREEKVFRLCLFCLFSRNCMLFMIVLYNH